MRNSVTDILDSVHDIIETMAKIFIYVSIVVTAFASLLLMNFISISINYKSKEIGILRAVGARSGDVFKIFFNESLIIASINFVLTTAVAAAGVYLINYILRYNFGLILTLLVFSVRQVCLILAISLVVAFISTFFPVMRIARKKPVEAIKM
ncbi:MAG TPA: FtsX-like permease family protein [Clostridia bacterium]